MTTDKKVEEPIDLKVNEELDGSATVDLPENMVAEDAQNEPEVKVHQEDDVQDDSARPDIALLVVFLV